MKNSIIIKAVSFERISFHHWAHHDTGRIQVTAEEFETMRQAIVKHGQYEIKPGKFDDRALAAILAEVYGETA
mgnify:CR=1 FL=1